MLVACQHAQDSVEDKMDGNRFCNLRYREYHRRHEVKMRCRGPISLASDEWWSFISECFHVGRTSTSVVYLSTYVPLFVANGKESNRWDERHSWQLRRLIEKADGCCSWCDGNAIRQWLSDLSSAVLVQLATLCSRRRRRECPVGCGWLLQRAGSGLRFSAILP